jgi:hypothetical protein
MWSGFVLAFNGAGGKINYLGPKIIIFTGLDIIISCGQIRRSSADSEFRASELETSKY